MQTTEASETAADIEAVLDESGPDYETFSFESASTGHRSDVYLASLVYEGTEYEVVVKFQPGADDRFAVEPKLHEYVADRTGVPIPRILVYEERPDPDIPPYFITERVAGENLTARFADTSENFWERVVRQIGEILGEIHAEIRFEAYGRLTRRNDRIALRSWWGDWQEFFEDLTTGHVDYLGGTPFEEFRSEAREAVEDSIHVVPSEGVPRLVHDDLQPANLLHSPSAEEPISAVLDWQDTMAAHPHYHLAQAEFLFIDSTFDDPDTRERLRDLLYEGYREHRAFDDDDRYERCRPVYQLSTVLWRMTGFDEAYPEDDLERTRAKGQYRHQFERLVDEVPR